MTPDTDPSFFKQLFEYAWAGVLALGGLLWKGQVAKLAETKADFNKKFDEHDKELEHQRDIAAKLFDKIDEHSKQSAQRHIELLQALHDGLSSKVDK